MTLSPRQFPVAEQTVVVLLDMPFFRWFSVVVTLSAACTPGAPSVRDGATDLAPSVGGEAGTPGAAMDSGIFSCRSSGSSDCESRVFAGPVDGGMACETGSYLSCDGDASFVDVVGDGDPLRLAFPMDSSCGRCENAGCQIWGNYLDCCGSCDVTFAACAGADGAAPCLDFHTCGRYVDRNGKVWLATLTSVSVNPDSGLDLQATVTITDRTTTKVLSVHMHVCGSASYCGIIC